mmetsp:Transcript_387/g.1321  ORF Transcript_387/g.1321 Transcript_387/m.1321 type:complete len:138 (+) Transcript_387:622-1035(+)
MRKPTGSRFGRAPRASSVPADPRFPLAKDGTHGIKKNPVPSSANTRGRDVAFISCAHLLVCRGVRHASCRRSCFNPGGASECLLEDRKVRRRACFINLEWLLDQNALHAKNKAPFSTRRLVGGHFALRERKPRWPSA